MMQAKVVNMRRGPFGKALAFFNILIGTEVDGVFEPVLVLKECVLKEKTDGSSMYFNFPAKLRTGSDGEPVKVNGYNKYDNYVDLYFDRSGEKPRVSDASWAVREAILAEAIAAYESDEDEQTGRGSRPKQAAKPAAARPSKPKPKVEQPEPEGEPDEADDDLPF